MGPRQRTGVSHGHLDRCARLAPRASGGGRPVAAVPGHHRGRPGPGHPAGGLADRLPGPQRGRRARRPEPLRRVPRRAPGPGRLPDQGHHRGGRGRGRGEQEGAGRPRLRRRPPHGHPPPRRHGLGSPRRRPGCGRGGRREQGRRGSGCRARRADGRAGRRDLRAGRRAGRRARADGHSRPHPGRPGRCGLRKHPDRPGRPGRPGRARPAARALADTTRPQPACTNPFSAGPRHCCS